MVDRKIYVVGFGLYGSIHGPSDYTVNIQVLFYKMSSVLNFFFKHITFFLLNSVLLSFLDLIILLFRLYILELGNYLDQMTQVLVVMDQPQHSV